ncbi:fimbrial protein, partial [Klebsiella pneumoniae]
MKLNVIATSLVLSSVLFSGATLAADGTVHFRGEVIDSTCTVTTDTSNQTVNIGRVSVKTFAGIDSTASVKDFHIRLEGCPATYTQAAVRFDG